MNFVKNSTDKGLCIPSATLKLSGFEGVSTLDLHVTKGALIVLKHNMTAMELLTAAQSLWERWNSLFLHLAEVCGHCEGCENGCPFFDMNDYGIELPSCVRKEAGIPKDAKLCACVDDKTQTVTVSVAGYRHDLRDVPPMIREMFDQLDLCVGELEERLMQEDIIYGD